MENKSHRFVICVDVDADNLEDAYAKLYIQMSLLPRSFAWESTDEAFMPDGEEVTSETMTATRMKVVREITS